MTENTRQEILKAHIYGRTAAEISAVVGVDITEITALLATATDEIAEKRTYIEQNGAWVDTTEKVRQNGAWT